MKDRFTIFVEGAADVKFLHDYIEYLFGITLTNEQSKYCKLKEDIVIQQTGGWTTLNSNTVNAGYRKQMQSNIDNDGLNLLIFDADHDFSQRQKDIINWKTKHNLDFELFLFPNNKDTGALESLLETIINPQNQPIFNCWEGLEQCLKEKTSCVKTPLTIPAKKSKIYAYMECLCGNTNEEKNKAKDANRDFKETKHWDLNAVTLNPLKDFLLKYLS